MSRSASAEFRLSVEAAGFDPSTGLNGSDIVAFKWNELLSAAITVGRWRSDIFPTTQFAVADAVHRVSCFYAYCTLRNSRLVMSPLFYDLDATEKGIVSYYLGMSFAKLYAEKYLGVPWLMHISRYGGRNAIKYLGKGRPDLFGPDKEGNWVVLEAKGRQRVTSGLLDKIKLQTSMVDTINGVEPRFRVGVTARQSKTALDMVVIDPEKDADAERLDIDPAEWIAEFYGPITGLRPGGNAVNVDDTLFATLPGTPVEIGLPIELVEFGPRFYEYDRAVARDFYLPSRRADSTLAGPEQVLERAADTVPLEYQTEGERRAFMSDFLGTVRRIEERNIRGDGVFVRAPGPRV